MRKVKQAYQNGRLIVFGASSVRIRKKKFLSMIQILTFSSSISFLNPHFKSRVLLLRGFKKLKMKDFIISLKRIFLANKTTRIKNLLAYHNRNGAAASTFEEEGEAIILALF